MGRKKAQLAPRVVYETEKEVSTEPTSVDQGFRDEVKAKASVVAADYSTVVDADRRYIEVSDSFCHLVGYRRKELIGIRYDDLTAPRTNDIPTVYHLFVQQGHMHGLWMLVHRTGTRILVRYESWVRPDCLIQSSMELVGAGY